MAFAAFTEIFLLALALMYTRTAAALNFLSSLPRPPRITSQSEIKLSWINEKTLRIVFQDDSTDKIHLVAADNIPGLVVPCVFSGTLVRDPEAVVSVTGCKNNKEEVVVEIASKRAGGVLDLIISTDGNTYKVKYGRRNTENEWNEGGDELFAGPDEPSPKDGVSAIRTSFNGPLPRSVNLEISLKYDNNILRKFGNDHIRVKTWLSKVVELAKPKMSLLDVKVHLKVVGKVQHYQESIRRATDSSIRRISASKIDKGEKGPISYFTTGNGDGIAWVGSACHIYSGNQINIVERGKGPNSELLAAKVLAHELAHNLGVLHDFDSTHGGNGNPGSNIRGCEGTGLMSYGSKQNPRNSYAVPIAWSTCSNLDFAKWYRSDGHKCLRPGADDTGDTGCKKPQQGYLARGDNVPGKEGIQSAGPDDCASKCAQASGCAAWTLQVSSNLCWLKTTGANKGDHPEWLRGESCTRELRLHHD